MKDTRPLQMRELAHDITKIAEELLDEGVPDPQEMLHVAAILQLAKDVSKRAGLVYQEPVCGEHGGFSAVCELPQGHEGKHRQRTFTWDSDSQRAFLKSMSDGRYGRLD